MGATLCVKIAKYVDLLCLLQVHMLPGLDLYYTDPAQTPTTAGEKMPAMVWIVLCQRCEFVPHTTRCYCAVNRELAVR